MSRLHLEIPQIYVVQRPRGYISPHLWQTGVPVAFLNYDLNSYQHYGNTSY
ncbi:FimD/PapC N-terminal domain-containing protein, partial [Glaesserella parasuis]|nr:FimD/PapC N-terminal domain-containing protein [Glaesserella parasuis]